MAEEEEHPGQKAVRDAKRSLRAQRSWQGDGKREEDEARAAPPPRLQSSSSLPCLAELLRPELGRPGDAAQPDGGPPRCEQLRRSNSAQVISARRPLLEAPSFLDCLLDPRVRQDFADDARTSRAGAAPVCAAAIAREVSGQRRGSSNVATALLILKSTVGGTLIVIPGAFRDAGLVSACLLLVAIGGIEIYCMALLIKCSRVVGGGSYGDIVKRSLGTAGCWAVDASLVLSQLGFVCAEMLYVAKNGHGALQGLHLAYVPSETQLLLLQLLLAVPMAWIRHLRYFKLSNIIANTTVLAALGVLMASSICGLAEDGPGPRLRDVGPKWLLFSGTAVFSFECINFVIPMYEAHESKDTFIPLLSGTLWGVVLLFILFGGVNYARYGDGTASVVTLNLPSGSPIGKVMPFAFALASLLNVPLFLFPASITIESKLFAAGPPTLVRKWKKNVLRTALVLLCTCIAIVGAKRIEALVAVIGSFCCVPLAFIYPALSHLVLCRPGLAAAAADCLIGSLGAFLFVSTTVMAVKELLAERGA